MEHMNCRAADLSELHQRAAVVRFQQIAIAEAELTLFATLSGSVSGILSGRRTTMIQRGPSWISMARLTP